MDKRRREYGAFVDTIVGAFGEPNEFDISQDIDQQRRDYNENTQYPPAVMFRDLDEQGTRRPTWEQMREWVMNRYFSGPDEAEDSLRRWQQMGDFEEVGPNEYAPKDIFI